MNESDKLNNNTIYITSATVGGGAITSLNTDSVQVVTTGKNIGKLYYGNFINPYGGGAITTGYTGGYDDNYLDTEYLLNKSLEQANERNYEQSEDGLVYFIDDKNLYIDYQLYGNCKLKYYSKKENALASCEDTLQVIDKIKNKLNKLQEMVFNKMLEQKNNEN